MAAIYQKSVSIFELLGSTEHETPCNREKIYLVVIRRHFTLRQKMIQNTSPMNMSIKISQKNAEGRRHRHFVVMLFWRPENFCNSFNEFEIYNSISVTHNTECETHLSLISDLANYKKHLGIKMYQLLLSRA